MSSYRIVREPGNGLRGRSLRPATWRIFELSVCVVIAVSPWTGLQWRSVPLADLAAVGALVALGLASAGGRPTVKVPLWVFLPTFASLLVVGADFLGLGANTRSNGVGIGGLTTDDVVVLLRTSIATAVVFTLIAVYVSRQKDAGVVTLLQVFVGSVALSALVAVFTEATGTVLFEPEDIIVSERAVGLAFHPNSLAQSIVVALPALFYLAAHMRSTFAAVLVASGFGGLFIVGLQLADSRGGLIGGAVIVALAVFWFLSRWSAGRYLVPAGVIVLVIAPIVWERVIDATRLGSGAGEGTQQSTAGRVNLLALGIDTFKEAPIFGAGLDSGAGVMVPVLLLSGGGVVLFAAFSVFVTRAAWTVWTRDGETRFLGLLVVLAPVLMGIFNNSFNERFDYVPLAVVAAAAINIGVRTSGARRVESESTSHSSQSRRPKGVPTPAVSHWRLDRSSIDAAGLWLGRGGRR